MCWVQLSLHKTARDSRVFSHTQSPPMICGGGLKTARLTFGGAPGYAGRTDDGEKPGGRPGRPTALLCMALADTICAEDMAAMLWRALSLAAWSWKFEKFSCGGRKIKKKIVLDGLTSSYKAMLSNFTSSYAPVTMHVH